MADNPGSIERKALLCIDGGGFRGVMSLKVLARLEKELAKCAAKAGLPGGAESRLADHFDLVAGTSVGAILASLIALRLPADLILEIIAKNKFKFFVRARPWHLLRYLYDRTSLANLIKRTIDEADGAETTLGSERLKTHLLLVMRNATTDSPWIIGTSRGAPFNRAGEECNLNVPLWKLIRASAAAPRFFAPEIVTIGKKTFSFVDGALTGFNNPAFKAFQYATTGAYGLNWHASATEDTMSIVSIGTGSVRKGSSNLDPAGEHIGTLASETPMRLIAAADREQDVLCRTFGRCLIGDAVDSEIGDLIKGNTALEPRLFRYYRINLDYSAARLASLGCGDIHPDRVSKIDDANAVDALIRIGEALADETFGTADRPGRIAPAEIARMAHYRLGERNAGLAALETAAG